MQRTFLNNFRFRDSSYNSLKKRFVYKENLLKDESLSGLRAKLLAVGIFLFYFIENGTLGLVPEKYYFVYRSVRISDFILYGLVLYSFYNVREYMDLFKSRPLFIVKIILAYFLLEFVLSAVRYGFNPIEYFFRLKGLWSSFLIFPYLLLIKRNGLEFLIKLIFPVAVISNFLYLLSALTGIPFLPDVSIYKQKLPGDIEIFRVYGGTFFGEMFFLGFVYYWITRRFVVWQLIFVILFVIPHVLAFGRLAWVGFVFTILTMLLMNSLKKRQFKVLFRQLVIIIITVVTVTVAFIKLIPESDFYINALKVRVFQGQEDVKYSEGTYGTRVIAQNAALLHLWQNSNILLGVGMHPMWVVGPDSRAEVAYYDAFCDVGWAGVLAAYGLIGFLLALTLQVYFIYLSFKLVRNSREGNIYDLLILLLFAKLVFDSTVGFSYVFLSTNLWGFFLNMNVYIAVLVHVYNEQKKQGLIK
ncbi:MAG: hypothetical protein N2510_08170 [Ignavibacteria bacterium]|nr:hypothetical protein [Ignavibacteria bacterium]